MTVEEKEIYNERLALAFDRIEEIKKETIGGENKAFDEFFHRTAAFILEIKENIEFVNAGGLDTADIVELKKRNKSLFSDILPENYEKSFANPEYAVSELGEKFGKLLSFLYFEIRSMIGFIYEDAIDDITIRAELFCEIYASMSYEFSEDNEYKNEEKLAENIKDTIYWFMSDYSDVATEKSISETVSEGSKFAAGIIMNSDLTDCRYLFKYGEYISDNELKMQEFMAKLPQDTINTMADTYSDGYIKGFEVAGIDLSKKKIVALHYNLGFERMMKRAIENFAGEGNRKDDNKGISLAPAIYRNPMSHMYGMSIYKSGFCSTSANRQYEFDHKDDKALFFDKNYINRKLDVTKNAYEMYKEWAAVYAGPAVVETFGEENFDPVNKKNAMKLNDEQNKLYVEYTTNMGELRRKYIKEDERSFTIISFPIPEIGEQFNEIFSETIKLNTLEYKKYQRIQQTIIDSLDQAEKCEIKGCNGNHTDLIVQLCPLKNPEKESKFENCVADVNIPVGEVFTSPTLEGTNGVLYVSKVFLNGLEFRDLDIEFEDGKIKDYNCSNFKTVAENKAFIKENILFRHETLPLGEFAIGTNTTAYTVARKYKIEDKFPILIAEKTGPHFAVGDTCYSHSEEVRVYNPDGKEIIAKDNSVSVLRNTEPAKAYFNCHTDITIPYDELGELTAVKADGTRIPIILDGRFVLPGTEELNEALE